MCHNPRFCTYYPEKSCLPVKGMLLGCETGNTIGAFVGATQI